MQRHSGLTPFPASKLAIPKNYFKADPRTTRVGFFCFELSPKSIRWIKFCKCEKIC